MLSIWTIISFFLLCLLELLLWTTTRIRTFISADTLQVQIVQPGPDQTGASFKFKFLLLTSTFRSMTTPHARCRFVCIRVFACFICRFPLSIRIGQLLLCLLGQTLLACFNCLSFYDTIGQLLYTLLAWTDSTCLFQLPLSSLRYDSDNFFMLCLLGQTLHTNLVKR